MMIKRIERAIQLGLHCYIGTYGDTVTVETLEEYIARSDYSSYSIKRWFAEECDTTLDITEFFVIARNPEEARTLTQAAAWEMELDTVLDEYDDEEFEEVLEGNGLDPEAAHIWG